MQQNNTGLKIIFLSISKQQSFSISPKKITVEIFAASMGIFQLYFKARSIKT